MLSVLIPTCGRPDMLDRCLRSIAMQRVDGFTVELIVGIDGEDTGEVESAVRWSSERIPMRTLPAPHAGPAATRNRIVREASGQTLLFLNDDVVASPGLLAAHVEAQQGLEEHDNVAMVLGSAPWAIEQPDRVIDRLTRETSLIFFYDQMTGEKANDPNHDWGWRHSWTLNLSLPAKCAHEVGGFNEGMAHPVYEDIEFAFRVRERFGAPTRYRPGAGVIHHHRYEPIGLLAREYVLGHQSRRLAAIAPACADELFPKSPLDEQVIDAAKDQSQRERAEATELIRRFVDEALDPSGDLDEDQLESCFRRYVRCRNYLRRLGLADAGRGGACAPPIQWMEELAAHTAMN